MKLTLIALTASTTTALVTPLTRSSSSSSALKAADEISGPTVDPWYLDEVEPDLSSIVGVFPGKNMPADYGFDPLGVARLDVFSSGDDDFLRVKNYRDAELRHGRLAMLAAAAWPIQEMLNPVLAKAAGLPTLLDDGRSPSVLNGGLGNGPIPFFLLATAASIGYLDIKAIAIKEKDLENWTPGDFGFDPLRLLKGASPVATKNMQAKEINNGRLAMMAVLAYVIQEASTGEPVISVSEQFFTPIIYMPWFQQAMTNAFGMASFR